MVLKYLEICLPGPICVCDKENLGWGFKVSDGNKNIVFRVFCKTCGSELVIPGEKLGAIFKLEKPYPGGEKNNKEKGNDENNQPPPEDPFFLKLEEQMKREDTK